LPCRQHRPRAMYGSIQAEALAYGGTEFHRRMRFIAVLSSCNHCLNTWVQPPRAAFEQGGRDAQVSLDDCRGGSRGRWSFRFQYRTSRDKRGEAAEFSPSRSPSRSPSISLSFGRRRRYGQAPGTASASHQQAVPGNCPSGVGVVIPVSSNSGMRWAPKYQQLSDHGHKKGPVLSRPEGVSLAPR
jgi:hypothetical protein